MQQTVTLTDIPAGAHTVKWWPALPGDGPNQEVLDFAAMIPGNLPNRVSNSHRVNTMIIGYAGIDGVEARGLPQGDKPAQLARSVFYTEVKAQAPAGVAVN